MSPHVHAQKKKSLRRSRLAVAFAIFIGIICFSAFLISSFLSQPSTIQQTSSTSELKAVIVDHLSLSRPNRTFIQTATDILEEAGYTVDYYEGEQVTVERYRNLPTHGYSLIILRVHSALGPNDAPPLGLFTSESFSETKYLPELLNDQLLMAAFEPYEPGDPTFFGIPPKFVTFSMNGKFQNSTVIHMGCDGLVYNGMAEAFIHKGAEAYVGWNGPVLARHTDHVTARLLKHLVNEKQTIKQAVAETMRDVGPDPVYDSLLLSYPEL